MYLHLVCWRANQNIVYSYQLVWVVNLVEGNKYSILFYNIKLQILLESDEWFSPFSLSEPLVERRALERRAKRPIRKMTAWASAIQRKKLSGERIANLEEMSECPALNFLVHMISSCLPSRRGRGWGSAPCDLDLYFFITNSNKFQRIVQYFIKFNDLLPIWKQIFFNGHRSTGT